MADERFDFAAFEAKLAAVSPSTPLFKRRHTGWWFLIVLGAAGIALWASLSTWEPWSTIFAFAGLGVELVAFGVIVWGFARDELPELRDAKLKFAASLDQAHGEYRTLLAWLRSHPEAELRATARYLRTRQKVMDQRFAIIIGPIDKLGMFPVVVGVYLQFKDAQWWPFRLDAGNVLLALAVLVVYASSLWAARLKLRLDLYACLLDDALAGTAAPADADDRAA